MFVSSQLRKSFDFFKCHLVWTRGCPALTPAGGFFLQICCHWRCTLLFFVSCGVWSWEGNPRGGVTSLDLDSVISNLDSRVTLAIAKGHNMDMELEDIKGGIARDVKDNTTLDCTEEVAKEGNGDADSMSAGCNGMPLGHVLFLPKTLHEETHPGEDIKGGIARDITEDNTMDLAEDMM
jgi:hypothetical protein